MHTHHVDNKLPLYQINKVSNLASLCIKCHSLVHSKVVNNEETKHFNSANLKKLDKYRGVIHGEEV